MNRNGFTAITYSEVRMRPARGSEGLNGTIT
jgi:hypothetical protein